MYRPWISPYLATIPDRPKSGMCSKGVIWEHPLLSTSPKVVFGRYPRIRPFEPVYRRLAPLI